MYEILTQDILGILSDNTRHLYEENVNFFKNLLSVNNSKNKEDLQIEFSNKYHAFARELKKSGYVREARFYSIICLMIWGLIPRLDVLKEHQKFFNDLLVAFGELLSFKVNGDDDYEAKYWERRLFLNDFEFYYYTEIAIPSDNYDESVCEEILSHLNGGF